MDATDAKREPPATPNDPVPPKPSWWRRGWGVAVIGVAGLLVGVALAAVGNTTRKPAINTVAGPVQTVTQSLALSAAFAVSPALATATQTPAIVAAQALGELHHTPLVVARDTAASASLASIDPAHPAWSLWIFGDTLLARPNASGQQWAVDTMAFTTSNRVVGGITVSHDVTDSTGVPTDALPLTPAEDRYNATHLASPQTEYAPYAGSVIADPQHRRVLLFIDMVWRVRTGTAITIGSSMAEWRPRLGVQRLYFTHTGLGARSPYYFGQGSPAGNYSGPMYEDAPVIVDRYLYVYNPVDPHQCLPYGAPSCPPFSFPLWVARVPLDTLTDRSTWRFYAGHGQWSSDPRGAVQITSGGPGATETIWSPYVHRFVHFYQQGYTQQISYRVAPHPWGPWSAAGAVPFKELLAVNGPSNYAVNAHPEFSSGRSVYLTYVACGDDVQVVKVTWAWRKGG